MRACVRYLLHVGLEGAVQDSGLHVLRDKSQLPQDEEGQPLLQWTQVPFGHVLVLY